MDEAKTCPETCPERGDVELKPIPEMETGMFRKENSMRKCYEPGDIPIPKPRQPGEQPLYLPQKKDCTSGDTLSMYPVGPWASGHLEWTPQTGVTGTRPVVDTYSITRYSAGEWRRNNKEILTPMSIEKFTAFETVTKKDIKDTFDDMKNTQNSSNDSLNNKIKNIANWKEDIEKAMNAMIEEIDMLDRDKIRLKGAFKIFTMPQAIATECLDLRSHRYEPDQVRDDTEQELIKEVALVEEVKNVLAKTLAQAEKQMLLNKNAKSILEGDWSDKCEALQIDKLNLSLSPESSVILAHPGVTRYPENSTPQAYWEHFCRESVSNCENTRKQSENLRKSLMNTLIKAGEDLQKQAQMTNLALAETVAVTRELCDKLEETLKETLQKIVDAENLTEELKHSLNVTYDCTKAVETRLFGRNYKRKNVENCRDEAQFALMNEAKRLNETKIYFYNKLKDAEAKKADLVKYRADLEKQIACKRKCLDIDAHRCGAIRAQFPAPSDFIPD